MADIFAATALLGKHINNRGGDIPTNDKKNKKIGIRNKNGIDIISLGKGKLRMVTHRDYTQNHHDYVLTTLIKMNGYA